MVTLFPSDISPIHVYLFPKTVKKLDLTHNQIEDQGAQYLADNLQYHTVNFFSLYSSLIS